jgi:hypothetical protein
MVNTERAGITIMPGYYTRAQYKKMLALFLCQALRAYEFCQELVNASSLFEIC